MTTPELESLERRLRRRFTNRALLAQALVHRSYLNESKRPDVESNERLEFLGDAAIGYVVARELFERFPDVQEGQLTELRAHLVRWETLAEVARRLRLGEHLVLGKGEEQTGGRERPMNLARALEAVIGAATMDGSLRDTQRLVLRLLKPELERLAASTDVSDIKSRLQTVAQGQRGATPAYRTIEVTGPDHARLYHVQVSIAGELYGRGEGRNKRAAERAAAAQAYHRLTDDAD